MAPLGRGGRRHCRQAAAQVNLRIGRWSAGQFRLLLEEYSWARDRLPSRGGGAAPVGEDTLLPDGVRRAALRAVQDGALGKAAKLLAETIHPLPADADARLAALHPRAVVPDVSRLPAGACGEDFSAEDVVDCLRRFPPGSSGGFSGLMPSHLLSVRASAQHLRVMQQVARIASDFAWGRLSPDGSAALASARLIPIGKKGGGVRPIAVSELIRRIAGKLLVQRYQGEASSGLVPLQLGVGFPGGAEAVIHKARGWLAATPPDQCLLQIDFANAYNTLDRQKMLQAVAAECPVFLPYATACYGQHAELFGPGFRLGSQQGVHQGDPLGPLLFAVTAQPVAALAGSVSGG